ncbi:MAG: hypothetical protein DMG96_40080 [Acidobacteria bacterium]|nr:MAG: hypothetical protein DMG96_40080 [Acidobacteriota bacterium]
MLRKHTSNSLAERLAEDSTAVNGFLRTIISQGVAVLDKCANPVCCAQFRYLYQGKLVEVEVQYAESHCSDGQSKSGNERTSTKRKAAGELSVRRRGTA